MHIALASQTDLPTWEVDDQHLRRALNAREAQVSTLPWDAPEVAWGSFDACLVRTTWDYHERPSEFMRWARATAATTRLFNPAPALCWNLHKRYLRELEALGFPCIPTVWLEPGTSADLANIMRSQGWTRGVIKRQVGVSAIGSLCFVADEEGLETAQVHLEQSLPRGGMMVQPYLTSVEARGELSMIYLDGQFSHGVRKLPRSGDYRVQEEYGGSDSREHPSPPALALGERLMAARELRFGEDPLLYARVDLLQGEGGELLIVELELVEPSLFFRHRPEAALALADGLLRRL